MPDELIDVLARFHREVVLPDMDERLGPLRSDMLARFDAVDRHFDAIYQRFDRLDFHAQDIRAALTRMEEQLAKASTGWSIRRSTPDRKS